MKTKGILDLTSPYYCQTGKINTLHKPRFYTAYELVTLQKPTFVFSGWACKKWLKKKRIIGSFWIGSYDTTYSQETTIISDQECWDMVYQKKFDQNSIRTQDNLSWGF